METEKFELTNLWRDHLAWGIYRALFLRYTEQKKTNLQKGEYLIPKKIHFIWFGGPLPEEEGRLLTTWKRAHPAWEIKLWTERDVPLFHLKNQEAFDAAKNPGERSDIFRYEILERFGGIYADLDVECIKAFDELNKTSELFLGITDDDGVFVYNTIIGCRANHPFMKEVIASITKGPGDDSFQRILETTGPLFFSQCFWRYLFRSRGESDLRGIVVLPPPYFYPFPRRLRDEALSEEEIKKEWLMAETYALHYWKTSWTKET